MAARTALNNYIAAENAVRRRIAVRRQQNAALAAQAAEPLRWLDLARGLWSHASVPAKVAMLSVAVAGMRRVVPHAQRFASLLPWAPSVARIAHLWASLPRERSAHGLGSADRRTANPPS